MASKEVASKPEVLNDDSAASRILSFVPIFSIFSIKHRFLSYQLVSLTYHMVSDNNDQRKIIW